MFVFLFCEFSILKWQYNSFAIAVRYTSEQSKIKILLFFFFFYRFMFCNFLINWYNCPGKAIIVCLMTGSIVTTCPAIDQRVFNELYLTSWIKIMKMITSFFVAKTLRCVYIQKKTSPGLEIKFNEVKSLDLVFLSSGTLSLCHFCGHWFVFMKLDSCAVKCQFRLRERYS